MIRAREHICGNCRFYAADPKGSNGQLKHGQCRYHPPRVFMVMVPQGPAPGVLANPQGGRQVQMAPAFPAAFPAIDPELWCGKHRPIISPEQLQAALDA